MTTALKPYPAMKDSGVPWLGEVPEHWQTERAKALFVKMNRPVTDTDEVVTCFRDGTVTLRKNRRVRGFTESLKEIGYQGIRRGDLVIHAMDAFAGAIGVAAADGKGTPVYLVCAPKRDANAYFYAGVVREMARCQWIQVLAKGIRERSTDFRFDVFGAQRVPVPPLPEQAAIVRFLDYYDRRIRRYIRAKQKLIKLLEEEKQAIIHRAVTGQIDVRTGKPYPAYKDSGVEWLGDVPEGWAVVRLARIVTSSNAGEVIDKGWWGRGNEVLYTCARHCLSSSFSSFPNAKRTTGVDLLLTRNGTPYVHRPVANAIYSNVVQRINLRGGHNREWIAQALDVATRGMKGYGVSIESLNYDMWKALHIVLPSRTEQDSVINTLAAETGDLDHVIGAYSREIVLLREYRTRLIADVVTGKLDVREAAAALPDEPDEAEEPEQDAGLDEGEDGLASNDESEQEADEVCPGPGVSFH